MKYIILFTALVACKSYGQNFDIDSLKNETKNDTTTFVYMTALWCSPCLEKMPYYDAYFQKTKMPFKIVYLFDIEKFNNNSIKKIFPHINFSNKILFIPASFYSTAIIQINAHSKMFKNFIAFHKDYEPKITNLEKFSLSSFITVNSKGNSAVFDAPDIKGLSIKQIDSLLYAQVEKK
jgi:thiol-disulfide isomerase/thioredoxin